VEIADTCGERVSIALNNNEKVSTLKQKITQFATNNIPDNFMKLKFKGMELYNN
jgi:hypothetical protein